jgi:hypothetical protein
MLLGYLYAGGPVYHRTPMAQELRGWLTDEPDPRLDVAAEIFYDVYLGALWRWIRHDDPTPGAFLTELDSAIEVLIHGLAASLPNAAATKA